MWIIIPSKEWRSKDDPTSSPFAAKSRREMENSWANSVAGNFSNANRIISDELDLARARRRSRYRDGAQSPLQQRSRAGPRRSPEMARREFRRSLDFDVGLHSNLHARVVAHRGRDELVAGDLHDFSRQPDIGRASCR